MQLYDEKIPEKDAAQGPSGSTRLRIDSLGTDKTWNSRNVTAGGVEHVAGKAACTFCSKPFTGNINKNIQHVGVTHGEGGRRGGRRRWRRRAGRRKDA